MLIVRALALAMVLATLVGWVWRVRAPGTFPLATLLRRWYGRPPPPTHLAAGLGIGALLAVLPVARRVASGEAHLVLAGSFSGTWSVLVVASLAAKLFLVASEEVCFRGALLSAATARLPTWVAVVATALLFAVVHRDRTFAGAVVLAVDGVTFASAFVLSGSLWLPTMIHMGKNVAVWALYGHGTVDLVGGPLVLAPVPPRWTGEPGAPEALAAALVMILVTTGLLRSSGTGKGALRRRPRGAKTTS